MSNIQEQKQQDDQNRDVIKYFKQPLQNQEERMEQQQEKQYETLQQEFDDEIDTTNLFKRNKKQNTQQNTTLLQEDDYIQSTNGLMNLIKNKNEQTTQKQQYGQIDKKYTNQKTNNTMATVQQAATQNIPSVYQRLYNQNKIQKSTNYQPRNKMPDPLETAPEVTERFEGNKITRQLTKHYNQKEQIDTQMKNYEQKRKIQILQSTNNKDIVEKLIKNMSEKDKQYWRQEYQKRINKDNNEQISETTKDMELEHQKVNGRDVYIFQEREYSFKPKINNYDQVMKKLKNQQLLMKGKKLDEQLCKINNVKPIEQYDFQPRINNTNINFATDILNQLTK